uniref:Coiled-coil domain-containing protein 176 n=1 Tax=Angiostrongylus cantonensis TaxID=6313 RepID=A0A0K0DRS9_ANGCA
LEIVVKDQLAKASRIEEALRAELSAARAGHLPSATVSTKSIGIGVDISTGTPARVSPVSFECMIPSCIERKKSLIQENDRLLGQIELSNLRVNEMEHDVKSLRHDLRVVEDHRDRLKHQLETAVKDRDSKIAEVAACNIVIARHQSEKDTMQKAIAYMEERMQVYQNTLMEHDLVVSDENSADWHRGFVDPRYNVMVSKRTQTTLTSEALSQHKDEFALTKEKLAVSSLIIEQRCRYVLCHSGVLVMLKLCQTSHLGNKSVIHTCITYHPVDFRVIRRVAGKSSFSLCSVQKQLGAFCSRETLSMISFF